MYLAWQADAEQKSSPLREKIAATESCSFEISFSGKSKLAEKPKKTAAQVGGNAHQSKKNRLLACLSPLISLWAVLFRII